MSDVWDPTRYEGDLAQGLQLSGESSSYFAAERVRHVLRRCASVGVQPRDVLEFGCGTGNNIEFLLAAFPEARVHGVELSSEMASAAAARFASEPRVAILCSDGADVTERYDLVFINGVFHHVEPRDRPRVLAIVGNLMRTGGLLALFDNNPLNPGAMWVMKRIPFDRHAKPVLARTLAALARTVGMRDVVTRSYFYFPNPLRALRALEPLMERLPLGAQYAVYARR